MKIKTSELIGPALDWAVAKAEGYLDSMLNVKTGVVFGLVGQLEFSTNWSQGGPILDLLMRRGLWLRPGPAGTDEVAFVASLPWPNRFYFGPTPLIAVTRCFVSSKLGDEVDVPEKLLA